MSISSAIPSFSFLCLLCPGCKVQEHIGKLHPLEIQESLKLACKTGSTLLTYLHSNRSSIPNTAIDLAEGSLPNERTQLNILPWVLLPCSTHLQCSVCLYEPKMQGHKTGAIRFNLQHMASLHAPIRNTYTRMSLSRALTFEVDEWVKSSILLAVLPASSFLLKDFAGQLGVGDRRINVPASAPTWALSQQQWGPPGS